MVACGRTGNDIIVDDHGERRTAECNESVVRLKAMLSACGRASVSWRGDETVASAPQPSTPTSGRSTQRTRLNECTARQASSHGRKSDAVAVVALRSEPACFVLLYAHSLGWIIASRCCWSMLERRMIAYDPTARWPPPISRTSRAAAAYSLHDAHSSGGQSLATATWCGLRNLCLLRSLACRRDAARRCPSAAAGVQSRPVSHSPRLACPPACRCRRRIF